ncbi:hypothetical protein DPMN_032846 [Dreissena polymorpha]|uniref:Uncharacterized protein n=1 Tax=Dreissena polymorpha TaxID=45954 RepID=A0A9D4M4Z2_DREPO|nr:hypothetical protein DPMN_032846 [Dreissena polymorpha]
MHITDYKGMGSALSYTPSCLSCNDTRPGAFSKDVDDKTKMEMYEEIRDAGAQLVSQLVTGTLSKCTIESTDETIRMCDSLATISGNPTFLTRETQNQVTDFLEKAIDNIKKAPDSMTVEEIEAVTALALETCTNIEQAANLGRDHPTKSDLKTQDVKVPFFSTNMDSTLDDVPAFDNDVDALASGKHIMNKEEQTLFTMSSVSTCAGIADDLIKILTGLKPMSDQPIEMKSGSIVTSVTKNTGSALENKTLPIGDCAIDLPSGMIASDHSDEPMIIQVSTRAAPGAPVEDGSPMGQHHRQVTIEFSRGDGTEYPVRNLTTPVIVTIAEDPNAPQFNWSGVDLAKPVIPADRADEVFFYHEVFVNNPAAIQIKFRPTNISKDNQLLVLVNFDEKPSLSVNKTNVKAAGMIPRNTRDTGFYGNAKKIDPYTLFVDKDVVGNDMGSWKIAVRQLLPHEINEYPDVASLPDTVPDEWKTNKLFTQDYQLFPVVMSCAFTRKGSSIIQTDGVKVNMNIVIILIIMIYVLLL